MSEKDQSLSEQESLALITTMINKAREVYHDTGISGILWGSVIAICSLVKLSEVHFNYTLPFDIYMLTFVAVVPQIIFSATHRKKQQVRNYDDRFLDYLWTSFGICIFLLIVIVNAVFHDMRSWASDYRSVTGNALPFRFSEFVSSFFLLLYGLPTFITGATCKFRPMLYGGLLCWVFAVITLFTTFKVDLLLTAIAAITAWLIPGIIAETEYRRAKKKELVNV